MSDQYKTLVEMGINDVYEIEKFSTRQEGDMDVLKIYFHRDPHTWLSKSKKFKFKRQVKVLNVKEGNILCRETTEPSPFFIKAVNELEQLVEKIQTAKCRKQILLEEIDHLEKVMERKIADIRRQLEDL